LLQLDKLLQLPSSCDTACPHFSDRRELWTSDFSSFFSDSFFSIWRESPQAAGQFSSMTFSGVWLVKWASLSESCGVNLQSEQLCLEMEKKRSGKEAW